MANNNIITKLSLVATCSAMVLVGGYFFLTTPSTTGETVTIEKTPKPVERQIVYQDLPVVETSLGNRYVLVDLREQKLKVFENGNKIMEAVISTGSERRPTPRGEFNIINKAPRAYSQVAQLYMPYWMAFTYDGEHWLGFHELPEWPDGTKEGEEHLGQPFSGGCIRLGIGSAKQLYSWAEVGDKVLVY